MSSNRSTTIDHVPLISSFVRCETSLVRVSSEFPFYVDPLFGPVGTGIFWLRTPLVLTFLFYTELVINSVFIRFVVGNYVSPVINLTKLIPLILTLYCPSLTSILILRSWYIVQVKRFDGYFCLSILCIRILYSVISHPFVIKSMLPSVLLIFAHIGKTSSFTIIDSFKIIVLFYFKFPFFIVFPVIHHIVYPWSFFVSNTCVYSDFISEKYIFRCWF